MNIYNAMQRPSEVKEVAGQLNEAERTGYYLKDVSTAVPAVTERARTAARGIRSVLKFFLTLIVLALIILCLRAAARELESSDVQSTYLAKKAADLAFSMGEAASSLVRYPGDGPYDRRFGYSQLPAFLDKLLASGFEISAQARISPLHAKLIDYGVFPIYHPKTQSGLTIFDKHGGVLFQNATPSITYPDFLSIPKLIIDTLLFIEDRQLLNPAYPHHNPAIEWDRFGKALMELAASKAGGGRHVPGGSTLATQIEKFRHSPEGRTGGPVEKLRQMTSASFRAYLGGKENMKARESIVLDYINSVPLAAMPGFGEVNGLGDGLEAYYDAKLDEVSAILARPVDANNTDLLLSQATAYRQVLSLFLAHRRPSDYLNSNPAPLKRQVDRYLRRLRRENMIPEPLYEVASQLDTPFRRTLPQPPRASFVERKAANVIRAHILSLLGLERLYDADRLDLAVLSTIDGETQQEVSDVLNRLRGKDFVHSVGLEGFRLLDSRGDPGKIVYSFTLYESTPAGNKLRVQTDNFDQPFNINEGVKLDLGSTAKLRTLITYLEIVEALHTRFAQADTKTLTAAKKTDVDRISQWALDHLSSTKDKSLARMLDAAMERKYSANPGESFFTAGGMHTFENFNKDDNNRIVTVREAVRHSINLPFIRLMRDIVRYYQLHVSGSTARTLGEMDSVDRQGYLSRFADSEGQLFLTRFFVKYKGKGKDEIMQILLEGVKHSARRYASVFYVLNPSASYDDFALFMRASFDEREFSEEELARLYKIYGKRSYSLADQGYLARVHPLELWVAGYLREHPDASLEQAIKESTATRQEVYTWLFKTRHKGAQDKRIRMLLEAEAFSEIHRKWQNLGYPLRSLVPSYATALGTSADRPDALAELMGIIVNNGRRFPSLRIDEFSFAPNTPYAAVLKPEVLEGQQVLAPEIAALVRKALNDVVENGTAIRLRGGFSSGGKVFPLGGKTGTGDHRYDVYGPGHVLKESRVVNRTATFVFYIGDRFFGTLTAFVHGPDAAKFGFTSALPVQLLKILKPALLPLIAGER